MIPIAEKTPGQRQEFFLVLGCISYTFVVNIITLSGTHAKREPLLGEGFSMGPCFFFMHLFIHPWYDGIYSIPKWKEDIYKVHVLFICFYEKKVFIEKYYIFYFLLFSFFAEFEPKESKPSPMPWDMRVLFILWLFNLDNISNNKVFFICTCFIFYRN